LNGIYIVSFPINVSDAGKGVEKKISAHLNIFKKNGFPVELYSLYKPRSILRKICNKFFYNSFCTDLPSNFFEYDFYYFRKFNFSFPVLKLLKKLHDKKKIIVLEIPTYPYDLEVKNNPKALLSYYIDKIVRKKIANYVDTVITFSNEDKIFNIKTIKTYNGILCSEIPIHTLTKKENIINIIIVAQFAFWNGYDRLIEGMNNYYKTSSSTIVNVFFIGDGNELENYKKLVLEYNLSAYISFMGFLSGKKLDEVFDKADIGVCSLANHRRNVYFSSDLKTSEYLARGLPLVSSAKIDIIPEEFPYCLYVSEDDAPIDINEIIQFHEKVYSHKTPNAIISEIRKFAEKTCDMSITMKPVIDYLKAAEK
jgi:hypothetical protein